MYQSDTYIQQCMIILGILIFSALSAHVTVYANLMLANHSVQKSRAHLSLFLLPRKTKQIFIFPVNISFDS